MSKKEILIIILVALFIIVSVVLFVLIINNKMESKIIVNANNEEVLPSEFKVKEIEVSEPEEVEIREVISIPELTPGIYYIKVNNEMNTVTIYIKDENGNYTIPVKAMICSTGEATYKNSTYKLSYKRWTWRPLFGNVFGQYATHINENILFHSVPYLKNNDPSSLEYWEYDKLGTTASAGCIRLKVEDAKWIYDNCLQGSIVEFYSSPDPGPLGKPSIEPISENEECRNWDPTDPNEKNPWNKFNNLVVE